MQNFYTNIQVSRYYATIVSQYYYSENIYIIKKNLAIEHLSLVDAAPNLRD